MSALAARQRDFMRALFANANPASPGLVIYRDSMSATFVAALEATYPVVRRLVGAPFFGEAARRFALQARSASGDLGDFGAELATFVAAYPPAAALGYLPDMARLEWACHESGRAPDAAPFDFDSLSRVPAADYERLTLILHPSVRLVRSEHPIAAIHAANAPGCDGTPAPSRGEEHVVIWRGESGTRVEAVAAHEWRFLDEVSRGGVLGDAIRELPDGAAEAALAYFVAIGVVCGFISP